MWTRKGLKKKAQAAMKQNFWRMVSVCFLIAMLTTAYPLSTAFLNTHIPALSPDSSASTTPVVEETASGILNESITYFFHNTELSHFTKSAAAKYIDFLLNLYSDSTSALLAVLHTVNTFFSEHLPIASIFLGIGVIFALLYKIFINNLLLIGEKRFFLESRNYKDTRISKIFFLYKLHFIKNPAYVMFFRSLYQYLWNLTIIGGIYKHYEYSMIPYILAENPKISKKNAFYLSKQLMQHNKRKLFLIDLSFIGWKILSIFTLGLVDFLYANPYIMTCKAEFYLTLRRNYVLSRSSRYEYLSDSYLEHVPSEDELLINKALYDDSEGPYTQISYFAPEQYPVFLFSVQPPFSAVKSPITPAREYTPLSYLFLFHAFSIFGWTLEALLQLLRYGQIVDSELLLLPWLPLYGICGITMLLLLKRFIRKPELIFVINFVVYTIIEYAASWLFELGFGMKFNEYSSYLLNLNGDTYISGGAAFALLACAFMYYLAPRWTDYFTKLRKRHQMIVCIFLTALFLFDIALHI